MTEKKLKDFEEQHVDGTMATLGDQEKSPEQAKLDAVHKRAIQRFGRAEKADNSQAAAAKADLEFLAGDQWPARTRAKREANEQPCLTLNMMGEKINQVIGDQRQARPQIKVVPYDDNADPETADILNGMIRQIINYSDGEMITDNAFENAVACGRGAFRVITEYEGNRSDDQIIKLKWIQNVFSVKWDPGAEDYDKQDGKFFFIYQDMQKTDYEEQYPGRPAEPMPSDSSDTQMSTLLADWSSTETVRVAEYFERETTEEEIVTLESGVTVPADKIPEGANIKRRPDGREYRRKAEVKKIIWYKINGSGILNGPRVFESKYFPVLLNFGKEINIGGTRYMHGMIRPGIDAQRMINYMESKTTEVIALQPIAPFLATEKQLAGHEDDYAAAAKGEAIYAIAYTPDDQAANLKPERITPPAIPAGFENRAAVNKDNLKSTMGIHDSQVGAQSNEISGKGILARQHQAERGTFAYQDNLSRTLRTLGRLLLDMIPRIYDADRTVRILGLDGKVGKAKLGKRPDGYDHASLPPEERIYDPQMGMYDVTITVGPSHATRRQETADALVEILRSAPEIAPIVLPRLAKMLDFPDADELAEDLEVLLPPEIRAKRQAERGEGEEEAVEPQILGPDGQPVNSADTEEGAEPEVPAETPTVDPTLKSKVIIEQAKAVDAVLEMRRKAKAAGLTDAQIDALMDEMEKD